MNQSLRIKLIVRDPEIQPRDGLDQETVDQYCEDLNNGDVFPPVDVFFDGTTYWLSNGWHRVEVHILCGKREIRVTVHKGTKRDAALFAMTANRKASLPLSFAERRRAALRLVRDAEWSLWSNRAIARHIGVSDYTIRELRKEETACATQKGQAREETSTDKRAAARRELKTAFESLTLEDRQEILAKAKEDNATLAKERVQCPECKVWFRLSDDRVQKE